MVADPVVPEAPPALTLLPSPDHESEPDLAAAMLHAEREAQRVMCSGATGPRGDFAAHVLNAAAVWHEAGYLPPLPSEDVWTAKLDGLRSSWTVAGEIIAGGRAVDGPTLAAAFGLVAIPWLRHAFGYTLSTAPKPPPSPLERAAAIMRESMPKAVSPFA